MKYKIQLLLLTITFSFSSFAQTSLWTNKDEIELIRLTNIKNKTFPASSIYYTLNLAAITNVLLTAPDVQTKQSNVTIQIPNIDGDVETFKIWESSNFAPELQAAFPSIRAYTGIGITDPSAHLYISLAPNGIQTMVLRADKKAEFIEPYTTDGLVYALFNSKERNPKETPFNCLTKDEQNLAKAVITTESALSNTQSLKKFRLALSCTGEYTAYFGGTVQGALAGMNATLTRVNGVFANDLAVKLELIANNTVLIYTNAATDPYSPASVGAGTSNAWNTELQNNLDSTIGFNNYDLGHLFGASGGGGNAACVGCVCTGVNKGSAYTSPSNGQPEGDDFDIDFVIHEMGHQLGAAHTFSYSNEGSGVQVEPGSGSTIMGYAGITNYDIQKHSDPYYTYESLLQIQNNLATKTCQTNISLADSPPVINAGASYTIPKSTPFLLSGTGTDADGDTILYTWEQDDNSSSATTGAASLCSGTKTTGPNFRSLLPGTAPMRYMPALNTILSSTTAIPTETPYEALSSVARTLNFVLTGRDNHPGGGQTNSSKMTITVDDTKGPLTLTSLNSDGINWIRGSTQTITWAVNSTNVIAGGANVNVLLSTDNGKTYPTILASNVPNNGSASITVPNISAANCRLMVKASNNIFFAINRNSFAIGYSVNTTCPSTLKNSTVAIIPSGATTFSTSSISISNSGTVKSISVSIDITHPNIGDLSLTLVSPNGTEVKLITDLCDGNNAKAGSPITFTDSGLLINCSSPVTGNVLPQQPLYNLIGQNATGTWKLKYMDDTAGNSGTLNSWTLNLCIQNATLGTEDFELKGLALYPNPVNEILNVSAEDGNLPDDFVIYNSLGQTILNGKVNSTSDLSIDTSRLSSGVYFIKMNKDNASTTLKFIKK